MNVKFLTVEDITHELGIGRTTAYKLVGKIKHIKIGRRILIAEEDLLDDIRTHSDIRKTADHASNTTDK